MRNKLSIFLMFLLPVFFKGQNNTQSKNTDFAPYTSISFKKTIFELGDICVELRKSKKRAYEISAGVKGLIPMNTDLVSFFWGTNLWSQLHGPRTGFLYKFYSDAHPKSYNGLFVSTTYLFLKDSYFHTCTKCEGESANINFKRFDLTFMYKRGKTNNLSKKFMSEFNFGIGFRLMYVNTKIVSETSSSIPYNQLIGNGYAFATLSQQPAIMNGWFITPVFTASWGIGGRIFHKQK